MEGKVGAGHLVGPCVKGVGLDPEGSGEPEKVFMDMVNNMSLIQTTQVAV